MRTRCTNPNHNSYKHYGGRGIRVCDEWAQSFQSFYAHVGPKPSPDHTLDRIDNDRGYEPGNVRWATWKEQGENRRNTLQICADGITRTIGEWAEISGIAANTIWQRIFRHKWPPADAVKTSPKTTRTTNTQPPEQAVFSFMEG